ncbi:MAG TPA: GNAT family N-acetyltransferase [Pyrinomonadaceae bacterium]|jgi:phosphinothricin acetyltransferase|nr:GNAT family N-acetyltransferase [Pyrinomonadaceae bacterium]
MSFVVDSMKDADWDEVRRIYLEGIATGNATFEREAPTWEKWDQSHLPHSRLVARSSDVIKGWAALAPVSTRFVYRGVADVSIYVGTEYRGEGLGRVLLEALIRSSESNGIWTLQAGIFPENAASITLHKRCGFREVGRRERIGQMKDVWRDTILLERRSKVVGV